MVELYEGQIRVRARALGAKSPPIRVRSCRVDAAAALGYHLNGDHPALIGGRPPSAVDLGALLAQPRDLLSHRVNGSQAIPFWTTPGGEP